MTTFLVSDSSGTCDSMWSNTNGLEVDVPLNKYLFIPNLDIFDEETQQTIGAERIIFYSGVYDQILLHQALILGMLDKEQYEVQAENCASLGFDSLSFVDVTIHEWTPIPTKCIHDQGLIAGGTGAYHAIHAYVDSMYNTKLAVIEACKIDPYSSEPVSVFNHTLDGDHTVENLSDIGNAEYDEIYSQVEKLILSMQTGERGGLMDKVRYSGCTTSPNAEAPPVDVKEVIEKYKKNGVKVRVRGKKPTFSNDAELNKEKIKTRKISA
ncbi:hypothetical protein SBW85_03075 [Vibrio plantisponsor]|uniref:Uncharacterized protein n=1 Tax=Vibrio plantisponsor TaxID=664643 RepID=A0ABU4IEF5_9VIBR|nr:hypothetical protein [Vibrio plantisponsor]MDW6016750.1 hypothetical protein [Vibrio plantisponsor]NNM39879.1 hypothetical protein [Vibrio plantisponsor]